MSARTCKFFVVCVAGLRQQIEAGVAESSLDGWSHQSRVRNLACGTTSKKIIVHCDVQQPAEEERQTALGKGELFEQVFERESVIEWRTT